MRGQNGVADKAALRARVEARRNRENQKLAAERNRTDREEAVRQALARQKPTAAQVAEKSLRDLRFDYTAGKLPELMRAVADKAPRILDPQTVSAFKAMAELGWVRPIATWQPRGKGRDTLFRSLADHLLAKYPTPTFFWSAFFEKPSQALIPFVGHVASGGSAFECVKDGRFPLPFTRKMLHELVTTKGTESLLTAVRQVQVKTLEGDQRTLRTWLNLAPGRQIATKAEEEFWHSVLAWFCNTSMLAHDKYGPICDYIRNRRLEEPGFSMKGRSALALIRAMEEWHRQLNMRRTIESRTPVPKVFKPSGLRQLDLDKSRRDVNGRHIHEVWHFREILSSEALHDEGRAMNHCVYSYAGLISSGQISIWTMTLKDETGHWRALTIEVRNNDKQIVQARGRFNKPPGAREQAALGHWAAQNNLVLMTGRW